MKFLKKWLGNPFDRLLKKAANAQQYRFLLVWNRGLGDVALGLYAIIKRIRDYIPHAEITIVTRPDLEEAFHLIDKIKIFVVHNCQRKQSIQLQQVCKFYQTSLSQFDVILENPNPSQWVSWQIGNLIPKLKWDTKWDNLFYRFNLPEGRQAVGLHVNSETSQYYGYQKDWPCCRWQKIIDELEKMGKTLVLFGLNKKQPFTGNNLLDLRGETTLKEMLSIIVNKLDTLIAPDSGILSLTYYIDALFDLNLISLWADPHQGILKQNVKSPNDLLVHTPIIGKDQNINNIQIEEVLTALQHREKSLCV